MHESYDSELPPGHGGHRRLGIIGGGQLASMTAAAARQLGCDVMILERYAFSPASHAAGETVIGDWNDPAVLAAFAARVDVVTVENEFVATDALRAVDTAGATLWPSAATLDLVQDKLRQKQTLRDAGLAVADFAAVDSREAVTAQVAAFGGRGVLKTRRNGYDGKGNVTIRSRDDIAAAWARLGGGATPLYLEALCPFARELAVIVTRGGTGEQASYPVVETVQRDHICHIVRAPAPVTDAVAARAAAMAIRAIDAFGGVGAFGVELFAMDNGDVLVNELAPRVHNSGHYTIEACIASQFENHVRAVMGWPLGDPTLVAPAAVMINLIGAGRAAGTPHGLARALGVRGAHVHVYGKSMSGPGRKMGHVTALGPTLAEAERVAATAAGAIHFGDPR